METLFRKARVALTPRSWMLKRVLSNGAVIYGRNAPGHGARGVYVQGDAVEPELQHLESFLPKGGVLIDIGANTGIFALKAAKHVGDSGIVIAVEPGLEMLNMLTYSVRANGFDNVRLRALCLGARTGEQKLWLNHDKPNSFSLHKRAADPRSESVLVTTLDDLCAWEGLDRIDYVKMDVVGAEGEVLAGCSRTLERFRPIVQVAIHTGYVPPAFPGYSMYTVIEGRKENALYVADGDERAARVRELGWQKH